MRDTGAAWLNTASTQSFNQQVQGDHMLSKPSNIFLRYVLVVDALSCLASGALQVAFTGFLSRLLGLSPSLLAATGDFLLVYGAAVGFLATRTRVPGAIIWLLILGNCAWGVASVCIVLGNDVQPTALGKGYIAVQALTVLILARLQYICVRRDKQRLPGQSTIAGPDESP
jgi:hypothetical protein